MHVDAINNYSNLGNWGEPIHLANMTDEEVVLILWGNARYLVMTGERNFDRARDTPGLWARWYGPHGVSCAKTSSDWAQLRAEFEANGWN